MPLNDTELRNYDSNVLRLPADKRKEYHAQVDRLIAELSKTVRSKTKIKITKVVKAGSFAKYTILRKTTADPVDVDVVFYIAGKSVEHETLRKPQRDDLHAADQASIRTSRSRTSRSSARRRRSTSSAPASASTSCR